MVNEAIQHLLETAEWFAGWQSGFRYRRSCADHQFRLAQAGQNALRQRHEVTACCLDIQAAFDCVSHNILRHVLLNLPIGNIWKRYLSRNLTDRFFAVRISTTVGAFRPIRAGVPQGAVTSPTLFIIFTNHLFHRISDPHVKFGGLADDVLLFISGMRTPTGQRETKERMEFALHTLYDEYRRIKLKLNADKTQAIRFSLANENQSLKICFNGKLLEWLPAVTYLGVVFDKQLLFTQHLERIIEKTDKRLTSLRYLCGRKVRMPTKQALTIYKAFIRPCIEWGCEAFLAMSPSNMAALQVVQNSALRTCLRRSIYASTNRMHQETNMPEINERIRLRTIKFLIRTMQVGTDAGKETALALFETQPVAKCPSVRTVIGEIGGSLLANTLQP